MDMGAASLTSINTASDLPESGTASVGHVIRNEFKGNVHEQGGIREFGYRSLVSSRNVKVPQIRSLNIARVEEKFKKNQ
ncbi:hypothetical protein V6N11_078597 [Hibiscus sabdariffa]|uniref:Uncharacterized protein n=1 Tax=Hibiscus sabdariffa TaxID=183260 RepID=A0ABR2TGI9_9ROSI